MSDSVTNICQSCPEFGRSTLRGGAIKADRREAVCTHPAARGSRGDAPPPFAGANPNGGGLWGHRPSPFGSATANGHGRIQLVD